MVQTGHKRRAGKRAMIEVQFNWILVLVIGVLVILFFLKISYTQKAMADNKLAIKLLNQLNLIITGAEVATSTASEIDVAMNKFSFECNEGDCNYYVNDLGQTGSKSYNGKSLFAPTLIQGQKITTWALDWNMPYKATNFLFITSPDIRYVFIHNIGSQPPQFFNGVIKKLPDQIDSGTKFQNVYNLDDLGSFTYYNEYMTRLVVYDLETDIDIPNNAKIRSAVNKMDSLDYKKISILRIIPSTSDQSIGSLEFYKLNKKRDIILDREKTYYLGEASLIGAILTDSQQNYAYPMESAYKRLNYVSKVYNNRTSYLKIAVLPYDSGGKCARTYTTAIGKINEIDTNSASDFSSLNNLEKITNIYEAVFVSTGGRSLQGLNDDAILFSCPPIY